jgi:hypothetical protein
MSKVSSMLVGGLLISSYTGCAAPPRKVIHPGAPQETGTAISENEMPVAVIGTIAEKTRIDRNQKKRDADTTAGTITFECSVKLPNDPTDNPELCRGFQMLMVEESGKEAARFRFEMDGRYRFVGRSRTKYKIVPQLGKNWDFTVEPAHALSVGEKARIQLRQKE